MSNSFSEALQSALANPVSVSEPESNRPTAPAKGNASSAASTSASTPLPDLNQIGVRELTPEEAQRKLEEAQRRKAWVHEAAKKIMAIQERIQLLESVVENGIPTPEDMAELKSLTETIRQISEAGDDQVRKHLEFAEFLEAIRRSPATAQSLGYFLNEVVARNHYRVAAKEEAQSIWAKKVEAPQGAIFFRGRVYLPSWKEKWPSQRAVEATLVRFARQVARAEKERVSSALERLKATGDPDLSRLWAGELGTYRLYFPARVDETGKKWAEGAGLVEVYLHRVGDREAKFVRVLEGAGSLEWFNNHSGRFIPHAWLKSGIGERATEEVAQFAEKLIRTVKGASRPQQTKPRETNNTDLSAGAEPAE